MKKYTGRVVANWIADLAKQVKERPPKPFPGKAPTRLMFSLMSKGVTKFYHGKPTANAYKWIQKRANEGHVRYKNAKEGGLRGLNAMFEVHDPFIAVMVEYDKNGIVTFSKVTVGGNFQKVNAKLWAHYHPQLHCEIYPSWLGWNYKVENGQYKIL